MARAPTQLLERPPAPPRRNREKLEVIIDTCSMGHRITSGISMLLDYVSRPEADSVFKDYRILIPIQLG